MTISTVQIHKVNSLALAYCGTLLAQYAKANPEIMPQITRGGLHAVLEELWRLSNSGAVQANGLMTLSRFVGHGQKIAERIEMAESLV